MITFALLTGGECILFSNTEPQSAGSSGATARTPRCIVMLSRLWVLNVFQFRTFLMDDRSIGVYVAPP